MRLQFWACLEPLCPPPEFQVPLTRPHEARHGDTVGFLANAERFRSRSACFRKGSDAGRTPKAILCMVSHKCRQGILVAAILLAAAPLGAHVVLRVHGDAKESGLTLAGFRTPLVAGHRQGGLCRMAVGRGPSGPWSSPPKSCPSHYCLERSLPPPQIQIPFLSGVSSEWFITYATHPPLSPRLCWTLQGSPFSPKATPLPSFRGCTWNGLFQTTCDYPHACMNGLFQSSAFP